MFRKILVFLLIAGLPLCAQAQGKKWLEELGRFATTSTKETVPSKGKVVSSAIKGVGAGVQTTAQVLSPACGGASSVGAEACKRALSIGAIRERGLVTALKESISKEAAYAGFVEGKMNRAVFQVLDAEGYAQGTGFVFERTVESEKEIWAAAAAHFTKQEGEKVLAKFYKGKGEYVTLEMEVKVRGTVGFHNPDMVLLSVPEQAKEFIFPLVVSDTPVKKGMKADSFGYHGQQIGRELIKTSGRKITAIEGWRMITSYNYGKKDGYAMGACGSPLLRGGRVVGMHLGSCFGQCSFVLNFPQISKVFFHELDGAHFQRDIKIFGHSVASLSLQQRLSDVDIYRNGKKIDSICITRYPGVVDYQRLEKIIPAQKGDVLRLRITTDGVEERTFFEVPVP